MTDDTSESHNIVQRSLALADCTFNNNNMAEQNVVDLAQSNHQKEAVYTNHTNKTVQFFTHAAQIEVTDGLFKVVQLCKIWDLDSQKKETYTNKDFLDEIPVNYLLGIENERGHLTNDIYEPTISGDTLRHFNHFKLNWIKVSLENFSITAERDASGGIQIMDELIFEVCQFTRENYGINYNSAILNDPTARKKTNLKTGIQHTFDFTTLGWICRDDMIFQDTNGDTPPLAIHRYYWLQNIIGPHARSGILVANEPMCGWALRLLNGPIGVSNIRLFLNFTTSITSNWTARTVNAYTDQYTLLPIGNSLILVSEGLKVNKKRRAITDVEQEVEKNKKKITEIKNSLKKHNII